MMASWLSCLLAASLLAGTQAVRVFTPSLPPLPMRLGDSPFSGNSTFVQLTDHSNASVGTFSQRYWWDTTYYNGSGSPIIVFTPGEEAADGYGGYLTNRTILGQYAKALGGAVVMIEHRYWGESSPFQVLDTKALEYLTLENSVADLTYFAKNVKLPFSRGNNFDAPWIMVGGSYSGALSAWTNKLSPDTYWAYHASSGPVEAVYDYWAYFLPIQKGMARNCSVDMSRIVGTIDSIIDSGDQAQISDLQDQFGLKGLKHADDFASAVSTALGVWQSIQFYSNYSQFFQMCDTIEGVREVDMTGKSKNIAVKNATIPGPDGLGAQKAMSNFARWFKYEFLPDTCNQFNYTEWNDSMSIACFDTYNTSSPLFTDMNVNNTINRQWTWMTCNQPFFYWQTGAPKDQLTIVSRHVSAEYFQRQCGLMFPTQGGFTFGSGAGKTADDLNNKTEGWLFTNTTRLLWANGEFDPWRSASVSSEVRPGGPFTGTEDAPLFLMPGARHCNDLITRNGVVNKGVHDVQLAEIKQMQQWVADFHTAKKAKAKSKTAVVGR